MNERRAELIYGQVLQRMDMTRETGDEELQELIRMTLEEASEKEYLPLNEKIELSRELFHAFRKLDILQELLEDPKITEIMVNGTDHIFYEKGGRLFRSERKFMSEERLVDVIQQIVGEANRYVSEASPIVDATIFQDDLTEDGTLVKLTAKLKYKEQSEKYEFYVRIFPARESKKEKIVRELKEAVQKEEEDTRTEKYLILPDEINGTKITWSHEKNSGTVGILIAGGGAAVMVFVSENQKKKEKKKRESEEMRRDYPQIINRFSLYIGAGMSVRNAWQRITEDYRKNKERTGRRKAYEEMIYTENQMKNKAAESECYEEYGIRCGLSVYRRFGTLLSQNLRKGSKGLSELLKRETGEMFEERKKQARKLGEEAGTKLMIPLFMMLAVVFIIVIVPAFFTIQI